MKFYYVISQYISEKPVIKKFIHNGGYCEPYTTDDDLHSGIGYAKKGIAITQAKRQQAINTRYYKDGDINRSTYYVAEKEGGDTAAHVVFSTAL